MRIIGLTGSIAMGKSTAAAMLRRRGLPVFDADGAVHRLLGPRGLALTTVLAAFPGLRMRADGGLERSSLGAQVISNAENFRTLERILHPLVRQMQLQFLKEARRRRRPLVVIDVPLLFETAGHHHCHRSLVVSAPASIQQQRALSRAGMSPQKLTGILARQLPDAIKRRIADHVIPTGSGLALTRQRLYRIIRHCMAGMGSPGSRRYPSKRLRSGRRADYLITAWRRR